MNKHFSLIVKTIVTVMLLAGAVMCAVWLPRAAAYLESVCTVLSGRSVLIYIGFSAVALPLFAVFFMAYSFVPAFEKDSIFDRKTARLIKRIAYIIMYDCILAGLLTGVITVMGESLLSPLFSLVILMGVTVAFMLFILANHVERASDLKEETEGIL